MCRKGLEVFPWHDIPTKEVDKMTKVEKVVAALDQVPPWEKAKVMAAFRRLRGTGAVPELTALSVAFDVVLARGRTLRKKASDAQTDAVRRRTVGARVPYAFYQRCRDAAEARGVSMYRWVIRALERALEDPLWME